MVSLRNAAGWYTSCFGRSEAETSKLPLRNMFGFASSQLPTFQIRVRDEMEPFYQTADSRIDCSHRAGWCATTCQLPTASSSHFVLFWIPSVGCDTAMSGTEASNGSDCSFGLVQHRNNRIVVKQYRLDLNLVCASTFPDPTAEKSRVFVLHISLVHCDCMSGLEL